MLHLKRLKFIFIFIISSNINSENILEIYNEASLYISKIFSELILELIMKIKINFNRFKCSIVSF